MDCGWMDPQENGLVDTAREAEGGEIEKVAMTPIHSHVQNG